MKKSALLRKVSTETGVPYSTVKRVMDSALEHIADSLGTGERVVLSGFGTFALRPYRARQWVNPQTGRQVDIPAALRPGFVTSAALKRRLASAPESKGWQRGCAAGRSAVAPGRVAGPRATRCRRPSANPYGRPRSLARSAPSRARLCDNAVAFRRRNLYPPWPLLSRSKPTISISRRALVEVAMPGRMPVIKGHRRSGRSRRESLAEVNGPGHRRHCRRVGQGQVVCRNGAQRAALHQRQDDAPRRNLPFGRVGAL